MRFEVPQFIDIEDKIFGPLTWKQFLYLGGGVGMAVVIFLTTNFWVFIFVGLPLAILSLALSFYNVNNRPFSYFLEAMFNYITRQRMYFWKKKEGTVYTKRVAKTSAEAAPVKKSGADISSMARRLELKALEKDNQ
jgi:hypothetical protein